MKKESIAVLIKRLELKSERVTASHLKELDLSVAQYRILLILLHHQGQPLRQRDIEARLGLTNPTVTGLVQKLEAGAWIHRVSISGDKRSKGLVVTDQAKSAQERFETIAKKSQKTLLEHLEVAERKDLRRLLEKCLEE